jgi:hypothetical protein
VEFSFVFGSKEAIQDQKAATDDDHGEGRLVRLTEDVKKDGCARHDDRQP